MGRERIALSIVIPVYNEAEVLPDLFQAIKSVLEPLGVGYEIIVVDDGSTDNTWDVILGVGARDDQVKALRFSRNFGKESAILAGLGSAAGQAVVVMDGDLQHPPEMIPEMFRLWSREGYQVVHGHKRERPPESRLRRGLTRVYYLLMKWFSGYDLAGETDFKLLDARVVHEYLRFSEKNLFFRGLTRWVGYRQTRVNFRPGTRPNGRTRWGYGKLMRLAMESVCSFSSLPLHLVSLCGAAMFLLSAGMGLLTLIKKMLGQAVPGFTTVILLLLFIGSLLMISLGIMGQYLGLIYEEIKRRPSFIVAESLRVDHESADGMSRFRAGVGSL